MLLLLACQGGKDDESPAPDDSAPTDTAPEDTGAPPLPSAALCDRVLAGPADGVDPLLALSAAHASVRFFGDAADFLVPDAALVDALEPGYATPDLDGYAAALGYCHLPVADALGPAEARAVGRVLWVRPGTGEVPVPSGEFDAVAVDLRGLPADPGLDAALRAAVGLALATPLPDVERRQRTWYGQVDSVYSASNAYSVETTWVAGPDWTGTAAADLPLLLVTDDRLAPRSAALAAAVAGGARGWILGEDVPTRAGELEWAPIGDAGLLWRSSKLRHAGEDLPDVLPAVLRAADPEGAVAGWETWSAPTRPTGAADRPSLPGRSPWNEGVPAQDDRAAAFQADLLVAHGAIHRFWPYFHVVGDGVDPRLAEVLATLPADRAGQQERVGRLGEALHDGHVFFGDLHAADPAGWLPVTLDHLDGQPVVVHSNRPEIAPGDRIVAVDGVPVGELYADWSTWHGAASEGYALDLAGRMLWRMSGTTTYTLADPDGVERDVTLEPGSYDDWALTPFTFQLRECGFLDDLGAPEVGYINLSYDVTTSLDPIEAVLDAADATTLGLVVDMRGYPGVDHYRVAQRLNPQAYTSPIFRVPVWSGPEVIEVDETVYSFEPLEGAWDKPIVLLTSPVTVSAAENFATMLVGAGRTAPLTVVGRPSAATNGNITGLRLPSGHYLSFTGMEVLFPDRSTFHGVGIVPDVPVEPTAADYRDGGTPSCSPPSRCCAAADARPPRRRTAPTSRPARRAAPRGPPAPPPPAPARCAPGPPPRPGPPRRAAAGWSPARARCGRRWRGPPPGPRRAGSAPRPGAAGARSTSPPPPPAAPAAASPAPRAGARG